MLTTLILLIAALLTATVAGAASMTGLVNNLRGG